MIYTVGETFKRRLDGQRTRCPTSHPVTGYARLTCERRHEASCRDPRHPRKSRRGMPTACSSFARPLKRLGAVPRLAPRRVWGAARPPRRPSRASAEARRTACAGAEIGYGAGLYLNVLSTKEVWP